jgi:flagellar protein FlaJ
MARKKIFNDFLNRNQKETPVEEELSEYESEQREIFNKIEEKRGNRFGWNRLRVNPIEVLTEKPMNILIVSVPLALLIFITGFFYLVTTYGFQVLFTSTTIDDVFIISVLVAVVPLAFLQFKEGRRERSIEEALPNFFRDLAGMNESGMTLPNAIEVVARGEYGTLTPEVHKLRNDISWNIPFVDAIYKFGQRLATPLAMRSVDLIAKASKAGGDVSEVLRAAATDSYEFVNLSTERRNNMLIYVIIVIVSFFVFLFVIAVLVSTFLTTMAEAGAAAASAGATGAFASTIDIFFYRRLFSHAAIIQGFFSGLVAGQMGEADMIAGLKYSVIMVVIAWVAFRLFI